MIGIDNKKEKRTASVSVFHLQLFDGPHHIALVCHRLFDGNYLLRGDGFEAGMAWTEARQLAWAGVRLRERGNMDGGPMKAGPVFARLLPTGGLFEIGIAPSGMAISVTVNDVHVDLVDEEQIAALQLSLGHLWGDVGLVGLGNMLGLAQTPGYGPIQSNVAPGLCGPGLELPRWADDEFWRG